VIEVRLFANLPGISRSKQSRLHIPYREGLKVQDLLEMEGLSGEGLAIMVNGSDSSPDTLLNDGDSVFLLPPIAGGRRPGPR
jgi:sulfur carrier protein ThiS